MDVVYFFSQRKTTDMQNKFAIVILSCDKYKDLWRPFITQLKKYFPENNLKTYLISNEVPCTDPYVTSILTNEDQDWSSSFIRGLDKIPESNLLILLEDLLISSPVDSTYLESVIEFFHANNCNHIKFWSELPGDKITSNQNIMEMKNGAPYRATVCGLWNKSTLIKLLIPGENPWNFEIMGSYRSSYFNNFFTLTTPLFKCENLVEKGHWVPSSFNWALKEGIQLNLKARPTFINGKNLLSRLKKIYFSMIILIPWSMRLKIMNILRKLLISY